jgi:hypothetical protein
MTEFARSGRDLMGPTLGLAAAAAAESGPAADLAPPEGLALPVMAAQLAHAPRRRDVPTPPRVLTEPSKWGAEALALVMSYAGQPTQVWDDTGADGSWMFAR